MGPGAAAAGPLRLLRTGSAEVGLSTIVRNLVLIAVAAAALVAAGGTETALPGPSLPMVVTVTSLAMAVALLLALRSVWPHLTLSMDQAHAVDSARGGE